MVAFENLTGSGWFYLVSGAIAGAFYLVFFGILIRNYFRKRTVGTGLLLLFFGSFILANILTIAGSWIGSSMIFGDNSVLVHGYFQIAFIVLNLVSFIFFYYFANRHILRDSDITKSFTSVVLTLLAGILGGLMVSELIAEFIPEAAQNWGLDQEGFLQYFTFTGTGTHQFLPQLLAGLIIFIPIILLVFVRVLYKLIIIRRNMKERVARIGVTFILISVIFIFLERPLTILFTVDAITSNGSLVVLINIIRNLFNIAIIVFAYLGWILPDWLKKAIRGKAWIVKKLEKDKIKTQDYSFISSESIKAKKQTVIEVSEP